MAEATRGDSDGRTLEAQTKGKPHGEAHEKAESSREKCAVNLSGKRSNAQPQRRQQMEKGRKSGAFLPLGQRPPERSGGSGEPYKTEKAFCLIAALNKKREKGGSLFNQDKPQLYKMLVLFDSTPSAQRASPEQGRRACRKRRQPQTSSGGRGVELRTQRA